MLHFLGRLDRQVKIGGVRVEPGEVEHTLAGHPDVAHAAVTVRSAVAGHQQMTAYASPVPGAALDGEVLRAYVAERLPRAYVPWTVITLDAMPLTERGKVDRDALPEPQAAGGGDGDGAPPSAEALRVAGVMGELLGRELPGPDDDFFALGGDSLLAIALVGRLRALGHGGLGVGAVFARRTPRALAAALEDASRPVLPAIAPRGGSALAPLTAAQRRGWLFGEMNPGARAYQHAGLVRIDGALDTAALRTALEALLDRHEALRSSIVVRDGEPLQRVHERVPLPLEELDLRGAGPAAFARTVRSRARVRIDLAEAPWLRWTLMRLAEERWALLCLEHHLAHDGWSFDVLTRELGALYGGATPPPPALQIGDVARLGGRQRGGARRPARALGRGARPGSRAAAAAVRPPARGARVVRRRRRAAPPRRGDRARRVGAGRGGGRDALPGLPGGLRGPARALRRPRRRAGRHRRRQPRRSRRGRHARDARQHDRAARRPLRRAERARGDPARPRRGGRRPLARRRPVRPRGRPAGAAARPVALAARADPVLVPRRAARPARVAGPRRARRPRAARRDREGRPQRHRRAARRRLGELRVGARRRVRPPRTAARIAAHHARLLGGVRRATRTRRRSRSRSATPRARRPPRATTRRRRCRRWWRACRAISWRCRGSSYGELWERAGGLAGALRGGGRGAGRPRRPRPAALRGRDRRPPRGRARGRGHGGARPRPPGGAAARDPRRGRRARGDRRGRRARRVRARSGRPRPRAAGRPGAAQLHLRLDRRAEGRDRHAREHPAARAATARSPTSGRGR